MPIDASIYDRLIQPLRQPESPLEIMQGVANLKDSQALSQQRQALVQEKIRAAQENGQIQQVMADQTADMPTKIQRIYAINPKTAGDIQQTWNASQKAQLDITDTINNHAASALALYDPAKPDTWGHTQAAVAALYQGVGRPVPKEFQGPPPDQDTVNRWQQTSMSVKDQIAARKKNLETKEVVGPDGKTVTLQTFDKETGQLRPMTDPSGQPVIAPKTLDVADKAADNARQAATETEREHHDRAMEAHARAMEARLAQAAVANNLNPQDIKTSVRTTLSGKQYLDMTDFESAKERSAARQAAAAAGIPAVDKATGASLRAIDTAKQNAQSMWDAVKDKLPKDASGRILAGPGNKLSAYFQTEPQLAAFNAFRTAAIQQVQALAEPGMGLRINQAEITAAMENDIPQITDDLATAATRLKNLTTMLNHKENDALTRDRSTLMPGAAPAPTAGKNPFRK